MQVKLLYFTPTGEPLLLPSVLLVLWSAAGRQRDIKTLLTPSTTKIPFPKSSSNLNPLYTGAKKNARNGAQCRSHVTGSSFCVCITWKEEMSCGFSSRDNDLCHDSFTELPHLICNNSFIGRLTTDGVARQTWLSLRVRVWWEHE